MNPQTNKHELSRKIPAPVKRSVRQRCGFGCVICGFAIYQYHHFDPPFEEAKVHNADGITLLCGGCHDRVNRGLLSDETVKTCNKNPKCLQKGFSHDIFDTGGEHPIVNLGYSTWIKTQIILEAFGTPLLMLQPPEIAGNPFRLSGTFWDQTGTEIFRIIQNEWQGPTSNWDIETKGRRIIIRRALGQITLQIRSDPPNNLTIEKLDMFYKGAHIIAEEGKQISAFAPDGSTIQGTNTPVSNLNTPGIYLSHVTGVDCEAGVVILEQGVIFGRKCAIISG